MDIGAEIQPIEETSLEEIKQSDNLTKVDAHTFEPPVVIKQHEKETPHADAAQITTGDHNGEMLKLELKTDVLVQKEKPDEATLMTVVGRAIEDFAVPTIPK